MWRLRISSEYHLVLNPDAELAEDALAIGLSSLQEDRSIVLLSPKVRGEDGAQEYLCKRYPSLLSLLRPFAPRFIRWLFRRRCTAMRCATDAAVTGRPISCWRVAVLC